MNEQMEAMEANQHLLVAFLRANLIVKIHAIEALRERARLRHVKVCKDVFANTGRCGRREGHHGHTRVPLSQHVQPRVAHGKNISCRQDLPGNRSGRRERDWGGGAVEPFQLVPAK